MKTVIEAPFTITPEKRKFIEDSMNDLEKYNVKVTQADIYFKMDDGSKPDVILAEIQLRVKGPDLFASDTAVDFIEAFTKANKQVERQLRVLKDKRTDKHQEKLWNQL